MSTVEGVDKIWRSRYPTLECAEDTGPASYVMKG